MTTTPEPDYIPFPPPPSLSGTKQPPLSAKESELFPVVFDHFAKPDYILPGVNDGELSEEEKFWLSHECMLRYLRSTSWQPNNAIKKIENTLKWRREYGLYDSLTAELVEPEAVTGKEFLFGYDADGRPAMYLILSRQNTEEGPGRIQLHVWLFERAIELMPPGVETVAVMMDYGDKGSTGSISLARQTVNLLQTHYPERLGKALVQNVPYFFTLFYKLLEPFIDPYTRDKVKFNPKVIEDGLFSTDMIMKDWGGTRELIWEYDRYWPALIELAQKRKKMLMEKWRELGATVGLKEWDVRSGSSY